MRSRIPRSRLLPGHNLLIRVVKLEGEFAGEDWLWRRRDPTIKADRFLRQCWLGPFWNQEHFSVKNLRNVGVVESRGISILRRGGGWVGMTKGISRVRLRTVLREED